MIKKTSDYDMFIFRADNREKIDQTHVFKLVESIKSRNMLDLRPICVNDKFEIMDGQHRLLAAKHLGIEIYYQVEKNLDAKDIILMNVAKAWTSGDYLNYYCQNEYEEYIKLRDFIKKHQISLKVALALCYGQTKTIMRDFKEGTLKFLNEECSSYIDYCWQTIDYIKKMNGFSLYTSSSRFWKALIKLVMHHNFEIDKWMHNIGRMIERFQPKARTEDYMHMFMEVYNWRNNQKINLLNEDL